MATVKDPVCGMMIEAESAVARIDKDGQSYFFCSEECRTAFEASPERYVGERAPAAAEPAERLEQHEPPYTVTGILTSPKFGSAGSGGLEYERLPEAHDR
jgi:YHS domain-containing protein